MGVQFIAMIIQNNFTFWGPLLEYCLIKEGVLTKIITSLFFILNALES